MDAAGSLGEGAAAYTSGREDGPVPIHVSANCHREAARLLSVCQRIQATNPREIIHFAISQLTSVSRRRTRCSEPRNS